MVIVCLYRANNESMLTSHFEVCIALLYPSSALLYFESMTPYGSLEHILRQKGRHNVWVDSESRCPSQPLCLQSCYSWPQKLSGRSPSRTSPRQMLNGTAISCHPQGGYRRIPIPRPVLWTSQVSSGQNSTLVISQTIQCDQWLGFPSYTTEVF